MKKLEPVKPALEAKMDALYEKAMELADEYWVYHSMMNEKAKGEKANTSYLAPIVRRSKTMSIQLTWGVTYFIKAEGKWKKRTKYIPKKQGHMFNLDVLYKNAPEWEKESIRTTETQFANIRKQTNAIYKIGIYMRQLEAATKGPKPNEPDEVSFG